MNLVQGVLRTWKKFGELSSLLIGRTFTSRTWFGQFDELQRSCVRSPKCFIWYALGTICRVLRTLCLIGWNLRALVWKRKKLGQQHTADGLNVFSLWLRRKWPHLWTCGRVSVICGTQQIETNKWVSVLHSHGIHCRDFQPWMDDRWHVLCVSMCTCVCVQPAQWSLGWSLHLVCLCVACTMKFGLKLASH